MRDIDRIDGILEKLGTLWKEVPDWRLGQVIYNLNRSNKGRPEGDIFYLEDEVLEKLIEEYIKKVK